MTGCCMTEKFFPHDKKGVTNEVPKQISLAILKGEIIVWEGLLKLWKLKNVEIFFK
jgi:alpha-D-ribose 1-methylphosphonate 5-triphosphate synthase subunit PhnL